jgi:uncharacterized membrane protein YfcA
VPVINYIIAALAAVLAGFINALAGGGTLITFPVLVALGLPAVSSNITNTVALLPGYLGGTLSQAEDLKGQKKRLWMLIPAGLLGGLVGGILLLMTGEKLFTSLVPFLILLASTLLALQVPLRNWLARSRKDGKTQSTSEAWAFVPIFFAAVYGGYFGAGLSVIILAVLGVILGDSLTRLNALKQAIAFATNIAAALFFVFSGQVNWLVALVMMVGALLGGAIGGKLASKIKPVVLRWLVVSVGFIVGVLYLVKNLISS